jgi:DNA-binding MarR family transcriptional regulator
MAKKNKIESIEDAEIRTSIKNSGKITPQDQFIAAFAQNPDLNRSKMAENLNVSRQTINKWIKKIEGVN